MRQLTDTIDFNRIISEIPENSSINLLLDYDGTLAPFRKERDRAFPYPGIEDVLRGLIALDRFRVIIISGRAADDIMHLLDLETYPEIWGCHGAEQYTADGEYHIRKLPAGTEEGIRKGWLAIRNAGLSEHCEKKPTSLAIHWRGLDPSRKNLINETVHRELDRLTGKNGLTLSEFDGGIELRYADIDKGDVIEKIIEETDDSELILYFGDDYTDEDAFNALKGKGISLLVRPEFRETSADIWIEPPRELIMILNNLLQMCGGKNG